MDDELGAGQKVKRKPKAAVKPAPRGKSLVKTTLSERTYEAIKERILDQVLEPGARLNIDAVSRELRVSSSPIREALARLAVERLVVLELYSGYSVAPHPTPQYLNDLLEYRMLTEGHCVCVGAPKKNAKTIRQLKQLLDKMASIPRLGVKYREYRRFVEYDARFHQTLVDSAENEVISTTYSSLNAIILQSRLYRDRQGGATTSAEVVEEHKSILRSFERGDGEATKQAICDHLKGGRRRLLDQL